MKPYQILLCCLGGLALLITLIVIMVLYAPRGEDSDAPQYVSQPKYSIQVIDDVMTAEECAILRETARPHMFKSAVYSSEQDIEDTNTRISEQCWLQESSTPVVKTFRQRIRRLIPKLSRRAHLEQVQVVRYQPGGFFTPHYDACVGSKEFCHRMDKPHGPRYITVLLYLSDGDTTTGGETVFPRIGQSVTPKVGRVVIFYNINKQRSIIEEALHGGQPVRRGEKWIANQWIRIW